MSSFSANSRQEIIRKMGDTTFDLLVIGGGITGAGIALDATARGLKVAQIDQQDFASGTSGRSTKLIHGGLRYLKQLEFRLVAEVGKERQIIHQIAPHLTKPEKMLLPIMKGGSLGKTTLRLAMWLYEWLAGVKKEEAYRLLNKEEALKAEPLLNKESLIGGVLFYEYRTDDARLTLEVVKEAVTRGATAINYVKASDFMYENGKISGVRVSDAQNGGSFHIKATYVINATGPWVDELDDLDKKHGAHKLHITKGVHIVVDKKDLPVAQSVYFDTFDGRMIFVIPRGGKTYIGTTDTFYDGELSDPPVLEEDKTYLLKCVNAYFPGTQLSRQHIESCWAGLRPLINKPGKGPSEISRKDEIFVSGSGLITIAGGKLTGYRKMAQRAVDVVARKIKEEHHKELSACSTNRISLAGGKMKMLFEEFVKNKVADGLSLGLQEREAKELVYRYGSNVDNVFGLIDQIKKNAGRLDGDLPIILRAEIKYAVENEMCLTPSDFFIRRSGMLYFDVPSVKKWQSSVVDLMQNLAGWSDELKIRYSVELQKAMAEAVK